MSMRIPIAKPSFGEKERIAVQRPLESGWVVQGPFVKEFERRFAAFVGASHAVATTSCSTALHLALAALGVSPGAEVIVPAFTWVATANAVEHLGGTPIFADVKLDTFNIDTAAIDSLISPRTVGILPVHLFGLCADMEPILDLASARGLWIVEDAACGFGAWYHGRHAGMFGDAGCFSFHPRKAITTGEGGMVITERHTFADLTRSLRDHGAARVDSTQQADVPAFLLPDYPRCGFNYRMTDIQGALGCAQMERASWLLAERSRVARVYDEALAPLEWLRRPTQPDGYAHAYQSYVCLFAPEPPTLSNVERLGHGRNELMKRLDAAGIATRQGTHAAAFVDYYRTKYEIDRDRYPNAWIADRLSFALPLYPGMTDEEQTFVCRTVVEVGEAVLV